MKSIRFSSVAALGLGVFLGAACHQSDQAIAAGRSSIRAPAVADRFYPGDADRLQAAVAAYLDAAVPASGSRPVALIVPHAGYVYSGQIAADAYGQALGHRYDVIVVLGTNHTTPWSAGMSVYQGYGYRTPLGVALIDTALAASLLAADPAIEFVPAVHQEEHSVEVQLPFLQQAFPGIPVVAAVVSTRDPALAGRLGQALARVLQQRQPLIVASSDLSHYPSARDAWQTDAAVLRAAASMDSDSLHRVIQEQMRQGTAGLSTCACGEGAMLCAMGAASRLGAGRGTVISYANSGGTVFGETERVVGYGAVAFTGAADGDGALLHRLDQPDAATGTDQLRRSDAARLDTGASPMGRLDAADSDTGTAERSQQNPPEREPARVGGTAAVGVARLDVLGPPPEPGVVRFDVLGTPRDPGVAPSDVLDPPPEPGAADTLTALDRAYLLQLARGCVTQYLQTGTVPLPRPCTAALRRRQGVFVTFTRQGVLRGCIGHMAEDTPLALATARMALQAALRDPRFPPMAADELPEVAVEISVLTPFERVSGPDEFTVGRDGVVLQKAGHRAVYLPQVAPAQGWDRAQTLHHLCRKAGLDGDCWQQDVELFTFQARVFAEASPH